MRAEELRFFTGTMEAGKSSLALQRAHNLKRPLLMKPLLDRDPEMIVSKLGIKRKADVVFDGNTNLEHSFLRAREDILRGLALAADQGYESPNRVFDAVIVDEAQFCSGNQIDQLRRIATDYGTKVDTYGLRADSDQHAFPGSIRLFEVANKIILIDENSVCACGEISIHNVRMQNGEFTFGGPQNAVDAQETSYTTMCDRDYQKTLQEWERKQKAQQTSV